MKSMVDITGRVLLYLLVCVLVGHVIAEEKRTSQKPDDLMDFAPAQALPFFQQ
jgi:hypothetical protein